MLLSFLLGASLLFFSSNASPADFSQGEWQVNHPDFYPPPEPLTPYYGEDICYIAHFDEPRFDGAGTSQDRVLRRLRSIDLNEVAPVEEGEEATDTAPANVQEAMARMQADSNLKPNQQEQEEVFNKAVVARFLETADDLGSLVDDSDLKKRFKNYATPKLQRMIFWGNNHVRELAAASILMHRPPQSRREPLILCEEAQPIVPSFRRMPKERILRRLYQVMHVAPADDLRAWFLERILDTKRSRMDIMEDLFARDRARQIKAVTHITTLHPVGARLWVNRGWVENMRRNSAVNKPYDTSS